MISLTDPAHNLNDLLNYRLLQMMASSIYVSSGPEAPTEIRAFGEFLLLFSTGKKNELAFIEFQQTLRPDAEGFIETRLTYNVRLENYLKHIEGKTFSGFEFKGNHYSAATVTGFSTGGQLIPGQHNELDSLTLSLANGSTIHIAPMDQAQAYGVRIVGQTPGGH